MQRENSVPFKFLKARSPVFQVMFSQRWNHAEEIEIPDIDPQTFRAFLEFVYADHFVSTVSDAVKLLYAANKYQVQSLINNIEKMIGKEMKLKHAISVFQAARKIDNKKIMKLADDVIATAESLEVLAQHDIIKEMDKHTLTHLLERDEMKAKELDLFNIAIKWGKLQVREERAETLNGALAGAIHLIRFPLMAPSEFASVVAPSGILRQDDLIQLLLYFASDYCAQRNLEKGLKFSTAPRKAWCPGTGIVVPFYGELVGMQETSSKIFLKVEIGFRVLGSKPVTIMEIIPHCPIRNSNTNWSCDSYCKIAVLESQSLSSDCDSDSDSKVATEFEKIIEVSRLELQWGEEMVVKVNSPYVLLSSCDYIIKLEQISNSKHEYTHRHPGIGGLADSVDVTLGTGMRFILNRMRSSSTEVRIKSELGRHTLSLSNFSPCYIHNTRKQLFYFDEIYVGTCCLFHFSRLVTNSVRRFYGRCRTF